MEDFFVMVLKSPGYIFGPLMLLGGLAAFVACVRATIRPDRVTARRALRWSLVAPALGVAGAIFGLAFMVFSGAGAPNARGWMALGCTIVFGVFVAVVPALWALVLLRSRRPTAFA